MLYLRVLLETGSVKALREEINRDRQDRQDKKL
jgi:hypothetical protein